MTSWMTRKHFDGLLQGFDGYFGRTVDRKALLLLDSCPSHGGSDTLPPLQHVKVEFLLPKAASKHHPLDAGIVSWVKTKFRKCLRFRIFDNMDSGITSIYIIEVLTAI